MSGKIFQSSSEALEYDPFIEKHGRDGEKEVFKFFEIRLMTVMRGLFTTPL